MNLVHLLLRTARWLPARPALAVGRRAVRSYGQMASRVARLAAGFRAKLMLQPGDHVALAMKNCPEYYELLFACWHAGLVAVPMNARLHAKEFAYILEDSGAKVSFATPELESALPRARPVREIENLLAEPQPPADVSPDDAAWLFYTSGTTGVPKGRCSRIATCCSRPRPTSPTSTSSRQATPCCTWRPCRMARGCTGFHTSPPAR